MAGNPLAPRRAADTTPDATKSQLEEQVHLAQLVEGVDVERPAPAARRQPGGGAGLSIYRMRGLLYLLGAVLAIYMLLPKVGGLGETWYVLRSVRWGWLAVGVSVLPGIYFAAALALGGAVNTPLGLKRTALVQLAGSFANKLTPKGLGGIGVNQRYLERAGVERSVAAAGIALNMAAGLVVHATALMVVGASLGWGGVQGVNLSKAWPFLAAAIAVMGVVGIIVTQLLPDRYRKAKAALVSAAKGLVEVLRTPTQAAKLFCGVAGVTAANVLMLTVTLKAFGVHASVVKVGAVYLGGEAVASGSPTPGNLGAMEAVLVANLTTVGVQTELAVAGVLVYRLLGFWLPIIPGLLALRYLRRQGVL